MSSFSVIALQASGLWPSCFPALVVIAQGAVGPDSVVMVAPTLNQDLGFAQRVEDLAVEQLNLEAGIKTLTIAVFPGSAWGDKSDFGADGPNPSTHLLGYKFRAIVRSYEVGRA